MTDTEKHYCLNACAVAILAVGIGFHLYTGNVLWWFGAMSAIYPLALAQMLVNGLRTRWWAVALGTGALSMSLALSIYHQHVGYWILGICVALFAFHHAAEGSYATPITSDAEDAELERSG